MSDATYLRRHRDSQPSYLGEILWVLPQPPAWQLVDHAGQPQSIIAERYTAWEARVMSWPVVHHGPDPAAEFRRLLRTAPWSYRLEMARALIDPRVVVLAFRRRLDFAWSQVDYWRAKAQAAETEAGGQ